MLVLGLHISSFHPPAGGSVLDHAGGGGAAALLRNGQLVAAVPEDRLSGFGAANDFPIRAIGYCLAEAGVRLAEVDAVAVDIAQDALDAFCRKRALDDARVPLLSARECIGQLFDAAFGTDVRARLHFCDHALAHAYSAWHASGFDEALCVCFDGVGMAGSGGAAHCDGAIAEPLLAFAPAQSLARLLSITDELLGLYGARPAGLHELGGPDETGLHAGLFAQLVHLQAGGRFAIASDAEYLDLFQRMLASQPPASVRNMADGFRRAVIAGAGEAMCRIVDHVLAHCRTLNPTRRLCLAGTVARAPALAAHVARGGMFDEVYVPAAPDDPGNPVGAAVSALRAARRPLGSRVQCLGPELAVRGIGAELHRWSGLIYASELSEPARRAADLVAEGRVVAWMHGRAGPGNRALSADPAHPFASAGPLESEMGKPIEALPDALACLLMSWIDFLIVDRWQISRARVDDAGTFMAAVSVSLQGGHQIACQLADPDAGAYTIERVDRFSGRIHVQPVSQAVFDILSGDDGTESLLARCQRCGVAGDAAHSVLLDELRALWRTHQVALRPAPTHS